MTAFFLYSQAKREKVKAENPKASMGEIAKILGEKWKGISDERRANYNARAEELKKEYAARDRGWHSISARLAYHLGEVGIASRRGWHSISARLA